MINLPKVYHCNGTKYRIITKERAAASGEVDLQREKIVIRSDVLEDECTTVDVLCHEMLEVTLHSMGLRYHNFAIDYEYLFSFSHKDYKVAMAEFASGVLALINSNRSKNA